jgi:hypothetical protein
LTPAEVQTLAAVIGLTDGMFVLGDRMDGLAADRLALLEQAHELIGGTAHVDLFAADPPDLVRSEYDDGEVIGVFNFGDRPRDRLVAVDGLLAGESVRDFWSGEMLPVRDGRVAVDAIPPHGCKLLWVEAAAEPTR